MHLIHYLYTFLVIILVVAAWFQLSMPILGWFGIFPSIYIGLFIAEYSLKFLSFILPVFSFENALKLRFLPNFQQMRTTNAYYRRGTGSSDLNEVRFIMEEINRLIQQRISIASWAKNDEEREDLRYDLESVLIPFFQQAAAAWREGRAYKVGVIDAEAAGKYERAIRYAKEQIALIVRDTAQSETPRRGVEFPFSYLTGRAVIVYGNNNYVEAAKLFLSEPGEYVISLQDHRNLHHLADHTVTKESANREIAIDFTSDANAPAPGSELIVKKRGLSGEERIPL